MTLVLTANEKAVPSFWAVMETQDLATARAELRAREKIPEKNEERHIGTWTVGQTSPPFIGNLPEWAAAHDVSHVVWTNLPPKFSGVERTPLIEEVLTYLAGLTGAEANRAEEYVLLAPAQIETNYRQRIEALFSRKRDEG